MADLFIRSLFTWRSAVASEDGPPNPTTRHVLLTLGLHMNERGESCFPSIELLTIETALSPRAVKEHLKIAAEAGWVGKREERRPNGQNWRRIEYFALIPDGVERLFHEKQAGAAGALPQRHSQAGAHDALRRGGAADSEGGARGSKGGAPDDKNVVHQVHPSTSKSTSRTTTKRAGAAARRSSLPDGFGISEAVREWATGKGWETYLDAHLEKFKLTIDASGRRYVDWDKAFMNCILDDWGDVRRNMMRQAPAGAPGWWSTQEATLAEALKLGLSTRGRDWVQLKGDVRAALDRPA